MDKSSGAGGNDSVVEEGFVIVSPGVTKKIKREGQGEQMLKGDIVTIVCVGSLDTNPPRKFWSTKDPGQKPFTFTVGLGQVIKGWDEGVGSMRLHESSTIKMVADKAYGKEGFPAWRIPPYADLTFDIEIIERKKSK